MLNPEKIVKGQRSRVGLASTYREVEEEREEQQRNTVLSWLTSVGYAPQQNYFLTRRQTGTDRMNTSLAT